MRTILTTDLIGVADTMIAGTAAQLRVRRVDETPALWAYEDVLAVPRLMGLYDPSGCRIERATLLHVTDETLVAPADRIKFERSVAPFNPVQLDMKLLRRRYPTFDVEDRPTTFLGAYARHYGHFLTDYSSRLWAAPAVAPDARRLFLPAPDAQVHRALPYVREMLAASGTDGAASDELKRPVLFRTLTIPEPALQARNLIFHDADRVHLTAARRLLAGADRPLLGRKVYLSRAQLTDGLRDVRGEAALEAMFTALGFVVVHPERLSFRDQVALFNSAAVIAGLMGSAFHTGLFSLPDYAGRLVVICGDEPLNARLLLQNAIKRYSCVFVRGYDFVRRDSGGGPQVRPDLDRLRAGLATAGVL